MLHSISIERVIDQYTGQLAQGGRLAFVRLPYYHGRQDQPGVHEVASAFSQWGPIAHCEQVDGKGGFVFLIGGDVYAVQQVFDTICRMYGGKADLAMNEALMHTMLVREEACGSLFGHKGEHLRSIKAQSGADVEVTPWCGKNALRTVVIHGTAPQIEHAQTLVSAATAGADSVPPEPKARVMSPVVQPALYHQPLPPVQSNGDQPNGDDIWGDSDSDEDVDELIRTHSFGSFPQLPGTAAPY